VTFLVERLAELRRHLDHLRGLQGRVRGPEDLEPIERFHALVAAIEAGD
jgi:hypothetical protein